MTGTAIAPFSHIPRATDVDVMPRFSFRPALRPDGRARATEKSSTSGS